jgi:ribonuclease P protein component|tara:strand:- start:2559 stop:2897 length:339 start_codon:yes stop_codon:yes gene_type:complete
LLIDSLNKGTDFNRVRRFGKKEKYKFITLSILSTKNDHFRLGFQISKKIGNAVRRNRIRRQIRHLFYEIFEKILEQKRIKSLWILIYVSPDIDKVNFKDFRSYLYGYFNLSD